MVIHTRAAAIARGVRLGQPGALVATVRGRRTSQRRTVLELVAGRRTLRFATRPTLTGDAKLAVAWSRGSVDLYLDGVLAERHHADIAGDRLTLSVRGGVRVTDAALYAGRPSHRVLSFKASAGQVAPRSHRGRSTHRGVLAHAASAEPGNLTPPTLEGHAFESEWLYTNGGEWSDFDSLSIQWVRCDSSGESCEDIAGADSYWRFVEAADVASRLKVRVTATNAVAPPRSSRI